MAHFLIFSSLLVFLLSYPSQSTATLTDECKGVNYGGPETPTVEFCITSLQTVPEASTADTAGLAVIATNLVIANATSTMVKIPIVRKRVGIRMRNALGNCLNDYDYIVKGANAAVEAAKAKTYGSVSEKLTACLGALGSCKEGLRSVGRPGPIAKENDDINKLMVVSLYFVAKLQQA